MSMESGARTLTIDGYEIIVDDTIGHAAVLHDGDLTWDSLQALKNQLWGDEARAIEVYPARSQLVNTKNCRHLWLLGADDFCPDLLGEGTKHDTLEARFGLAWHEAWAQRETLAKNKLGVS